MPTYTWRAQCDRILIDELSLIGNLLVTEQIKKANIYYIKHSCILFLTMWSIALTGSWNSVEQIYCKLENTSQRVCVHVNVYCYLIWISRVKLCIDNQCLVQIFCCVGDLVPTRDRHWSIEKFDSSWRWLNFAITLTIKSRGCLQLAMHFLT